MNTNLLTLLSKLTDQLNGLNGLRENDPHSITEAINIVASTIVQVNDHVRSVPFSNEQEEIHFFKKIKPEFDGRMIFYLMLLRLSQCSLQTGNTEVAGLSNQLHLIDLFYKTENAFYLYYKLDRTHLDDKYFLRKSNSFEVPYDEDHVHFDLQTNTYMSAKAARIVAYELFKEHINRTFLAPLSATLGKKENKNEPGLRWAASVADFMEFVYSAHEYGLFGKGIKISTLINFLAPYFGVKVTNGYKTWEDIRLRKKDRTPFIRSLLTSLERRIDHDNEFAP